MLQKSSKSGGKKSHACGPCRRLKRKCDLKVPCTTCSSGRTPKIQECLANPATPLNNSEGRTAPNLKFGRIIKPGDESRPSPPYISVYQSVTDGRFNPRIDSTAERHYPVTQYQPSSPSLTSNMMLSSSTTQHHIHQQQQLLPLHQGQQLHQVSVPLNVPHVSVLAPPPLPQYIANPIRDSGYPQSVADSEEVQSLRKLVVEQSSVIERLERRDKEKREIKKILKESGLKTIPTPPNDTSTQQNSQHDYIGKYTSLLPDKIHTTVLVQFYLQNIDYIYHPLHHPTFKKECEEFWTDPTAVDLGWLAVLFMVISLAAIHLPKGLLNMSSKKIEKSQKLWFSASRECFEISDSEKQKSSKFDLYSLQTFSLCQLYFYSTKRAEALQDILLKAVKDAYAMGLDEDDSENPNLLEVEMKRRLWWDICGCDTYRALSLGVKPMIRSYISTVPLPSNCNDSDITPNHIKISSLQIATDNSFNIYRAQMLKILNGIFEKNHNLVLDRAPEGLRKALAEIHDPIFRGLLEVDYELCRISKSWFFQLDAIGKLNSRIGEPMIQFQHHMLHTCICLHRFRIYQKFLADGFPIAWEIVLTSAKALFLVYRQLREIYDLKNPLFLPQIHQSFTCSVIQSMLLLFDNGIPLDDKKELLRDIEQILNDLQILGQSVFTLKPEVLKESFNVLNVLKKNINKKLIELGKDQKDIVSNIFGGEDMTENYLQKCTVSYILDSDRNKPVNNDRYLPCKDFDQYGVEVTEDLIRSSTQKLNDLFHGKDQRTKLDQETVFPYRSSAADTTNSFNVGSTEESSSNNINNKVICPADTGKLEPTIAEATPFPANFYDYSFWDGIGQQGMDELNSMYYSDYSGYRPVISE